MHYSEKTLFQVLLIAVMVMFTLVFYCALIILNHRRRFRRLKDRKIRDQVYKLELETKKIGEDMHDELGPVLSATKFRLESLESFSKQERPELENCISMIDQLITRIRQASNGLMLNTLVYRGLEAAVEELFKITEMASRLEIVTEISIPAAFPNPAAVHIFRIIQEITRNTVKHADARHLEIRIYRIRKKLFIYTADNGRGFNLKRPGNKAGLGMNNIRNRVRLLNGKISVKSVINTGTFYDIQLPLPLQN